MSNQQISRLYDTVRTNDARSNAVTVDQIRSAIEDMNDVSKPRPWSLSSTDKPQADFNTVAHRCAYLHKYAPLHTAIVRDELKVILNQEIFWKFRDKLSSKLKICSLGGGPGSDLVGVVAALSEIDVFKSSAKVVDLKSDWADTLRSVVHELRSGDYGVVGQCFQAQNFHWDYLTADLLENDIEDEVLEAIGDADLVTMVKFVSAASCTDTQSMLQKIFRLLKPGSMVLFIDNASGGFTELMWKVSQMCNMKHLYGPINHKFCSYEDLKSSLCGYLSCYKTRITIHLLEKQNEDSEYGPVLAQAGIEPNVAVVETWVIRLTLRFAQMACTYSNDLEALGLDTSDNDVMDSEIVLDLRTSSLQQCQIVDQHHPQSLNAYQPKMPNVEFGEELESQVNCCSSCVIS